MKNRFAIATAAVFVVAAVSGCSSGVDALGKHLVHVRIDGNDAGSYPVSCSQVQWLWRIATPQEMPGVIAQVHTGDPTRARSVQINNLGGFTGSFWEGTTGSADASLVDGTFTVSGTAEGYFHDDPGERTTATFELTTEC